MDSRSSWNTASAPVRRRIDWRGRLSLSGLIARIAPRLFRLPRYQKTIIVALVDVGVAVVAAWAAIFLRIGQSHWLYGCLLYTSDAADE